MSFLAPVVGGVAGAIFGGKDKKQTTTYQLPPEVQAAENRMLSGAEGLAGRTMPGYGGPLTASMSPYTTGAAGIFGDVSGLTKNALGILNGDPNAIRGAMNPYLDSVIGGINKQYDLERNATQQQLADSATRAGAFGGDRYGVALGQNLADVNRAQAQQVGQLDYQGYNDVLNRAAQNLGFGMNAAGAMAGIGSQATALQQQNNQALYQEFLRQQQMPFMQQQALQSAVQAAGWLRNGTTTQTTPGAGILGGAIGGAMAGQGLWNMFGGGGGSGGPPLANTPMNIMTPDPTAMLPTGTMGWQAAKLPGQP